MTISNIPRQIPTIQDPTMSRTAEIFTQGTDGTLALLGTPPVDPNAQPGSNPSLTLDKPTPPATAPDMKKVMAAFEDLILLLSKLGKEVQTAERENEIAALQEKVALLLSSADTKTEGAKDMRTTAIIACIVTVAVGITGAVFGGIGALAAEGSGTRVVMTGLMKAFEQGASVGGMLNSLGQAENQLAQASADRIQAQAEETGTQGARSQQVQQDMRDLLSKMVDLLNSFYAAQDKINSAASH